MGCLEPANNRTTSSLTPCLRPVVVKRGGVLAGLLLHVRWQIIGRIVDVHESSVDDWHRLQDVLQTLTVGYGISECPESVRIMIKMAHLKSWLSLSGVLASSTMSTSTISLSPAW
jgi:hypothetical protein